MKPYRCRRCDGTEFVEQSGKRICPPCRAAYFRAYGIKHRESRKAARLKYRTKNRKRVKSIRAAWWTKRGAAAREAHRLRKYGITPEQKSAMLAAQGGVCAICGGGPDTYPRGPKKGLTLDHDHSTTRARGLLCRGCNLGLGHFRDDAELLVKAYEYLNAHKAQKAATA